MSWGLRGTVGEQLGTGWRPALRILEAVPQDPEVDSEAVGLAFQSVQLLSSDYMAALPLDLLRTSLEVAAIFGSQQVGHAPLATGFISPYVLGFRGLGFWGLGSRVLSPSLLQKMRLVFWV